jgi:methylamine---glutamate N-methyltransferase subunit C
MADIDLGPLAHLVGTWNGDKGSDLSPEPDGEEVTPYYETIVVEVVGDVTNAEEQVLLSVRYHQVVRKKANDEVFHDEIGYWQWDAETGVVAQSLAIPRAVAVLAGGTAVQNENGVEFSVAAADGDKDWGIVQSPFMRDKARTVSFTHTVSVSGNSMSYEQTINLEIYGKSFAHTDANTLTRE